MKLNLSKNRIIILDGALGTLLQQRGLPVGELPELLNMTNPALLQQIYREYIDAGSQIIFANTFGANALKLSRSSYSVTEVIRTAVKIAKQVTENPELSENKTPENQVAVALDIGPLGELLEPMGSLRFERAYELFREMVLAGKNAGADLIAIETMTDLYEAKAALLAAKENAPELPVFVTMSFEASGRTFTGCTIASMARTLEGLGADAIGFNCSLGPDTMAGFLKELRENTHLPVIAKPNAGLPNPLTGQYEMSPEAFVNALLPCAELGVTVFGGCCGTGPEYIRLLTQSLLEYQSSHKLPLQDKAALAPDYAAKSFVCTPTKPIFIQGVRVIGERLNPTGKKRFQQALLENNLDAILDMAIAQEDAGADILDVNTGYPGVDEVTMLPRVVKMLQSAVSLPLQLDSSNPAALEAALRVYNGKSVINSVNGDPKVLAQILPLAKKYGAAVIGLCLDEQGIPSGAEARVEIARRILNTALDYGIPREDVWIDCLTLTVSAQPEQAEETLRAVEIIHRELGLQTVLGVSNISFGLPNRGLMNQVFLTQALTCGLTLPIINPNMSILMDTVMAFRVLSGEDTSCRDYIARFAEPPEHKKPNRTNPINIQDKSHNHATNNITLEEAVIRGLRSEAAALAGNVLEHEDALELVEQQLIPALDQVGEDYERGILFLPQLLSAAQAAQAVFEVIRDSIAKDGGEVVQKGKILLATVQGDIHDIGKNIVRTVLENYGYQILDLGRDVPPEIIVQTVLSEHIALVGLSALMTTTLPAMAETVRQLRAIPHSPVIFVGGAVVTPEYAQEIGADFYARDAKASVEIAKRVFMIH